MTALDHKDSGGNKIWNDLFKWSVSLSHRGQVTQMCVGKLGHHKFRYFLVTSSEPSQHMNMYWFVVNLTHGNKFHWNIYTDTYIFIKRLGLKTWSAKWQPYHPRPNALLGFIWKHDHWYNVPDSKVHGATWVRSAPDWPHVSPTNLAIRDGIISITNVCRVQQDVIFIISSTNVAYF